MGVKGLWQYIEHHQITYLPPNSGDAAKSELCYALRPQHLLLDMNAVLHICYSPDRPNSKATLAAVKKRVADILRRIQPSDTLVVVFDGVAPVAKLAEQKARRKGLAAEPPKPAPKPSQGFAGSPLASVFTCDYENSEVPLRQEHITAGSEFVYACERLLFAWLAGADGTSQVPPPAPPPTWKRLLLSSCTEAGEGEVKIARHIRRIWQEGVAADSYDLSDAISIVGNDSDLLLVALAATPYRYLTVVDPDDFTMTCLNELLDHWSKAVPNPPLANDLLPSWRLDFVFIMLLSGGDYYDGVRGHALELWRRYRDLRANHGFYRKQLVSGPNFVLDVNFLRCVTEKVKSFMPQQRARQKGGPHRRMQNGKTGKRGGGGGASPSAGSVAQGTELLKAAMWNFKGYVLGRCVDYTYVSPIKRAGEIPLAALRAAAEKTGVARAMGAGVADGGSPASHGAADDSTSGGPTSRMPPLSALEQCLAVLGIRSRYSKEMLLTIECFTPDNGGKLTTSQSTHFLIDSVKELMSHVDVRRLSGAEQALHAGGTPAPEEAHGPEEAAFMTFAKIKAKQAAATKRDDDAQQQSATPAAGEEGGEEDERVESVLSTASASTDQEEDGEG